MCCYIKRRLCTHVATYTGWIMVSMAPHTCADLSTTYNINGERWVSVISLIPAGLTFVLEASGNVLMRLAKCCVLCEVAIAIIIISSGSSILQKLKTHPYPPPPTCCPEGVCVAESSSLFISLLPLPPSALTVCQEPSNTPSRTLICSLDKHLDSSPVMIRVSPPVFLLLLFGVSTRGVSCKLNSV